MDQKNFSKPLNLCSVRLNDPFWASEIELIRKEVIPYQWDALNDRIPNAEKSFCMRNFREAGKLIRKKAKSKSFIPPAFTFRGINVLPDPGKEPEEGRFYGYVFQDSDFSKWIEAVGYSLSQHPDPALERLADGAIDIVCAAQAENGYLDTYYILGGMDRAFTDLQDHHELYCLGHLIEGAISYYRATGKDKLLRAAERFADYAYEYFGEKEGQTHGYPGHEIAEMALAALYELTGKQEYLDLSAFFINERGKSPHIFDLQAEERARHENREYREDQNPYAYEYYQAAKPVREQTEAVGHAVRAVYLYSGMADVARLTLDAGLFEAARRLWDNIVSKKLYITGGIGGTHIGESFSHSYDLPNDTAYSETCAAIGLAFFARRMLQIEPNVKYADICERALYNTVLAGMAMDGKSFFYVNPLETVPFDAKNDERKAHVKTVRQKWFGCACCPPNIARTVSNIASYAFTASEDTLFIHLYAGAEIDCRLAGSDYHISVESGFPFDGKVSVSIEGAPSDTARIAFRIPGWCKNPSFDGAALSETIHGLKDGYLYIPAAGKHEIDFPMTPMAVRARTAVSEDIGKIAFIRGPLTYCAEWADNSVSTVETGEAFDGSRLARLVVDSDSLDGGIRDFNLQVCGRAMKGLEVDGYIDRDAGGTYAAMPLYGEYDPAAEKRSRLENKTVIRLIPYFAWANRGEGEMRVWLRTS